MNSTRTLKEVVARLDAGQEVSLAFVDPLFQTVTVAKRGCPALFSGAVFDSIALIAATILLVLAFRNGFLTEKKSFIVLLIILVIGTALGVWFWTLS